MGGDRGLDGVEDEGVKIQMTPTQQYKNIEYWTYPAKDVEGKQLKGRATNASFDDRNYNLYFFIMSTSSLSSLSLLRRESPKLFF